MTTRAVVDIGGTKIAAACVGADGLVMAEPVRTPTPRGGNAVLDAAAALVRSLPGTTGTVGVAAAGVIDTAGVVQFAATTMREWAGTDVRRGLQQRLGRPVKVINDVHAVALGEAHRGAGQGKDRVLAVAVGTGIGGGFVTGGRIDRGSAGFAGSVGHVRVAAAGDEPCTCGGLGHAEAVASGSALQDRFAALTGEPAVPLPTVAQLATTGDAAALATIRFGGAVLGEAIASAASICDPDVIVIGGGVAEIGDEYLQAVQTGYSATAVPLLCRTPLVPALLGVTAPLVGAGLACEAVPSSAGRGRG